MITAIEKEEVDTKPKNESRERRLERMRISQKKLKDKRKRESESLKQENERLKAEIQSLRRWAKDNDLDAIMLILFWNEVRLTKNQFRILMDSKLSDVELTDPSNFLSLQETEELLITRNPDTHVAGKGIKLLVDVSHRFLECFGNPSGDDLMGMNHQEKFKFVPKYGLSLVGTFFLYSKMIISGLVPKKWLEEFLFLPEDHVSIFDAINIILSDELAHKVMVHEVLVSFLGRYSSATPYGHTFLKEDLNVCIQLCGSSKFDEEYLMGTFDLKICLHDYLKAEKLRLKNASQETRSTTSDLGDDDSLQNSMLNT